MSTARRASGRPFALGLIAALAVGVLPASTVHRANAATTELFFSEYIEGTSNNKALEIYNGTGASVNLSTDAHNVQMFFNGNPVSTLTINLVGTVADSDVFVLAQSSADATILAQADQTNGAGWFNGDDAVVLRKGTTVIDVIGQVGFDPGTEWGTGLTSTMDNTLRRKASVQTGDTDGSNAFDPASEWDGFATNTFDGLGSHLGNPVVATCGSTLATEAGAPATRQVTATDADGVVVGIAITAVLPSPSPGTVVLSNLVPAVSTGGVATADVTVDGATPSGSYAVEITATNNDPTPRTGMCTLTIFVLPPATAIHDIQGATHRSTLDGGLVRTTGLVTATAGNGFYLQGATVDASDATSEAIFVFTSGAPGVTVSDAAQVTGTVDEFRPGGEAGTNLSTTEIVGPLHVVVTSTGNPLPSPTILGTGGRVPPSEIIEDDAAGSVETSGVFDPATDGIDFYESLEGMRVQVNDAVAVGPTNDFGEIAVVGDGGANASVRTTRGGIVIQPTDFNPERILLDDVLADTPDVHVGDSLGTVVGVMDYSFANFKLLATSIGGVVSGGIEREATDPANTNQLAIATFNVENLDPGDPDAKFDELATLIVDHLRSPDILAIEEVQDNNGPTNDGTVDASATYAELIGAISGAGGPTYDFRGIDPVNNQDGGEPGGNIRVGFLFRTDRGVAFVDRPGGTSTAPTTVVAGADGPELSFSPGRLDPTNTAFNASRKPLAGEFTFQGETLFLIANHFNSKGGDQPLFGRSQPPIRNSEVQRHQQAAIVDGFVDTLLAQDPTANVVVLGDINDFEFSTTMTILKGGSLHALMDTLPQEERYSYVFEGNSQSLDHIVVSDSVFARPFEFDVVHVNAEFHDQASDHDPQVVRIKLGCAFSTSGTTMTLLADCTPDETIFIPAGFTLDGAGHTMTAVDPGGGHFVRGVVENAGTVAHVTNLTVGADLADVCDPSSPDLRLRGILFEGAAGTITNNQVIDVNQGMSGCQEGNGIEVRNAPFDTTGTDVAVTISGNTVTGFQKTGILANGSVVVTILDNIVAGWGPTSVIAQNGIQIGFGGSGFVRGNSVSGNFYVGSDLGCGLLFFMADGVKQQANTFAANERDVCNFGRGGGNAKPG